MNYENYLYNGKKNINLNEYRTDAPKNINKEECLSIFEKNKEELAVMQEKLFADGKEGIIVIIQALDAAGKDSIIKHVFGCFNPQGCDVTAFKVPSSEDLKHDYMWRIFKHMPERGGIAVFNRSYYEDVIVVKVNKIYKKYAMPERTIGKDPDDFFDERYKQILNFENYAYQNGYRVVKLFLNVSADKQRERFIERMKTPSKNWKFNSKDLIERELRSEYLAAFVKAFSVTATEVSPWYIVPADTKWYTRYLVSEILINVFKSIDPQYPPLPESEKMQIPIYIDKLNKEK